MLKNNFIQIGYFILGIGLLYGCSVTRSTTKPYKWYKGNLHAHSFWSDGNDFPEMIMDWYRNHDYQFAVLSDHNTLQEGEKWIEFQDNESRLEALRKYKDRFGEDWVEEETDSDGKHEVRLKMLNEYRGKFEKPGEFLIIQSEELTDRFESKPLHVNATNIQEVIPAQGGESVSDVLQNNIDAVNEQRERTGVPMIPHINHPNFGWAVTPEDIIEIHGERFFEVYNGHPAVHNFGDETRPGMDELWDRVLTSYLLDGKLPLYGLAVDDSHNYHEMKVGKSNSGRGWIRVKASSLSPEAIIEAMEAGDFYASSGVEFDRIVHTEGKLSVAVRPEEGVNYTIRFIGTKNSDPDHPGVILQEVKGRKGSYTLTDDDLYVRATVISDKLKVNPYVEGEVERGWVQPAINGQGTVDN